MKNKNVRGGVKHSWTKEDIKKIIKLWSSKTTKDLADEIGVSTGQIGYIAMNIRKSGYKLPRKTVKGQLRTLIGEVIEEL